ncbi:pyridoxamine 5'-phosphate oxidase family protein [Prauserella cavernicola]|uniref:Pyridoxamine 5'-phosphate oxidase family protein n=1 Tax=Prauserella cavernicola TaxID=2800127 RepID=A0A934V3N2_9PSEU|nr:pyridoxamine 5'-phosphate oxidase family protein [Prauserella cavernicola]MBK1783220.1 pyridoxamine 5'-phosphate oxidase family protein [Prauserella cavernicola]
MTTTSTDKITRQLLRTIERRSFCTLATSSPAHRAHVAGVLYATVGSTLYVSTLRGSRKARNVAANPNVGVCIPVRRLPVGPPSSVQFQAVADVLAQDDPRLLRLVEDGALSAITKHGELTVPDGCFLRITPARTVFTYGVGMPLLTFLRDPLNAAGSVTLSA